MKQLKIWNMMMLMVIAFPMVSYGQKSSNDNKLHPIYCMVWPTYEKGFKIKVGIDKELAHFVCDSNNEPVVFETTIGTFNYMSEMGWVCVQRDGDGYLFMKEAINAQEAYKSLNPLRLDEIKKARKAK